ncbi:kallikrein-14-like [Eublepharis macularius]|uniref:Kallikrein-14-like n=1 Tax=Eublepharis macularius TaxID=481883 RepID=A0AA97KG81_EUBMA|nr:kallikrein-14-like [Eublepharis macularius]
MTPTEEVVLALLFISAVAAQPGPRIVGGTTCIKNSQPWHVALYDSNRFYCSGTLLNRQWVLTAAHCKMPGTTYIRLGVTDMAASESNEQQRRAMTFVAHPNYDPVSKDNDIMMIKLSSLVDINDRVQPINVANECAAPGTRCLVTGWGTVTSPKPTIPEKLQCAYLNIVSQGECERVYPDAITNNMLCAGEREGNVDSCQGDSGAPLLCDEKIQGIVSWGPEVCGQPGKPGIYTKVCNYVGWIQQTMRRM